MNQILQNILDGLAGKTAKPSPRHSAAGDGQDGLAAPAVSAPAAKPVTVSAGLAYNSTGADYEEFLKLMQQGKRPFRKPGLSVMQEYELWLAHKAAAAGTMAVGNAKA